MLNLSLLNESDLQGHPHGCSHIRLLRPFSHPSIVNALTVTQGMDLPTTPVDVVIVERSWRPGVTLDMAQKLVASIRERGAKLIYTLDDNLIDLNEDAPWEIFPNEEQRMVFRFFSRHADGLIVSTDNLKRRFLALNPRIFVIPNALDERLFPASGPALPRISNDIIKIGYMGTKTHASDLMMILAPLRDFLRRNDGKVIFELVGVYADTRVEQCFKDYPVRFLDVGEAVDYAKFIPWATKNLRWDYALAPLEDTLFNRSKSDIKFLDYAMLGVPGIFSAVSSYRDTVVHRETGWLCDNRPDAWSEALATLLTDSSLRDSMASNASDYVINNRTLRTCAINWLNVVKTIAAN